MELLSSKKVDGLSLITEVRSLDQLVPSLEDMAAGRGSKYVVQP